MTIEWVWGLVASFALLAFAATLRLTVAKQKILSLQKDIKSLEEKISHLEKDNVSLKTSVKSINQKEQYLSDSLNDEMAHE